MRSPRHLDVALWSLHCALRLQPRPLTWVDKARPRGSWDVTFCYLLRRGMNCASETNHRNHATTCTFARVCPNQKERGILPGSLLPKPGVPCLRKRGQENLEGLERWAQNPAFLKDRVRGEAAPASSGRRAVQCSIRKAPAHCDYCCTCTKWMGPLGSNYLYRMETGSATGLLWSSTRTSGVKLTSP
jgi:hypothetical protein